MADDDEDPTNRVRVTFEAWTGELAELSGRRSGSLDVAAATGGYSGESDAWFDARVVVKFAEALSAYPLPDDGPITLSDLADSETDPDREYLGLAVAPIGIKGQIGFTVHLAGPRFSGNVNEVHLRLLTTYERLRFSKHLVRVVHGEFPSAEIGGEELI
jgi:hypothetical protein